MHKRLLISILIIFLCGLICVFSSQTPFFINYFTMISYEQRSKLNIDTSQFGQISKVKVCLYQDCGKGLYKVINDPEKVILLKQFIQNYSTDWVEDKGADLLIEPIATMGFYNEDNTIIDNYYIGPNYLKTFRTGTKWRLMTGKELQTLFIILDIPNADFGK